MRVLVFGLDGWIGGYMRTCLEAAGFEVVGAGGVRCDNVEGVRGVLDSVLPDRVLSLVGRTHGEGHTTIDYLEQKGKLRENVRDNLFGPLVLAHECKARGVHFAYLGTGCIFCAEDPEGRAAYTESDDPDFFGSAYSTVKGFTDRMMRLMFDDGALNARIRMPISADMSGRSFVTKIVGYERVCSIANSMTVLPVLLPLLCDMIKNGVVGTVNLVNPGSITHNRILEMYREHVDPGFAWKNFTIEEQDTVLLSKRSNNVLCTERLESLYPEVVRIEEAVEDVMRKIGNGGAFKP